MDIEFKSWLCICEHQYLKLVKVTLFEKVIDHNLIYDHNTFAYQQLIYSGIILKLFIDDRNSFHIEERKNLGLYKIAKADEIKHQIVSQHKDEVKTDALNTLLTNIQKNDPTLLITPNTPSSPNILPPALQQQPIHIQTQVQAQGYERKNKMSPRVIDETTLRVYFPKNQNTEALFSITENSSLILTSSVGQDMATSTRGLPFITIAPSLLLPTMPYDFIRVFAL